MCIPESNGWLKFQFDLLSFSWWFVYFGNVTCFMDNPTILSWGASLYTVVFNCEALYEKKILKDNGNFHFIFSQRENPFSVSIH